MAIVVDGQFGPQTAREFQWRLRVFGFYTGEIDGWFGPMSMRSMQRWLNARNYYNGSITGSDNLGTRRALRQYLQARGYSYPSGYSDPAPWTNYSQTLRLQRWLNSFSNTWH